MPVPSPTPFDDDDALADALADAWIEQARTNPVIRRLGLWLLMEEEQNRDSSSLQAVADVHGLSKTRITQLEEVAIAKLYLNHGDDLQDYR